MLPRWLLLFTDLVCCLWLALAGCFGVVSACVHEFGLIWVLHD